MRKTPEALHHAKLSHWEAQGGSSGSPGAIKPADFAKTCPNSIKIGRFYGPRASRDASRGRPQGFPRASPRASLGGPGRLLGRGLWRSGPPGSVLEVPEAS